MSNSKRKYPLEAHTRTNINTKLINLGFCLDENSKHCNVFQERAKTEYQDNLLNGKNPDYLIYSSGTDTPIAVIEAKRPGIKLENALLQASELYAKPLRVSIVFVTNDTFVYSYNINENKPLKIDGAEIQDFVDEVTIKRFIENGSEIESSPKGLNYSKEELLSLFKRANNLLRKAGLRDGYERFSVFADILFLKLMDDLDDIAEISKNSIPLDKRVNWKNLMSKPEGDIGLFLEDSIKPKLREKYGDVFDNTLNISNENILKDLLDEINTIDFNKIDSDIKGDAFEFFLKNVTNGNKDLGEYYTPRHIIRTIINLISPKFGQTIYDPFCGTGGFLLECFKYLSNNSNMKDDTIRKKIKTESIFGREITSTARIAKMNMILFGDGHTNIIQMDSLEQPVDKEFDIVVSNIPYSQKTDSGGLYSVPTDNGDSVFIQHMWRAVKDGGTMAAIVPETFLYDGGVIKDTRKLIVNSSESITVVSLPRGVFNPYTPTKTSIFIARKKEKETIRELKDVYYFIIRNDGFELGARRRVLPGKSDYSSLLAEYNEKNTIIPNSIRVAGDKIKSTDNYSLLPFSYMEHIPITASRTVYLKDFTSEKKVKFNKEVYDDDDECAILQVSKKGIFLEEIYSAREMGELSQKYKKVSVGDIVYNPHRINIGSIGVVQNIHPNMFVSSIYVVFETSKDFPPHYLVSKLKSSEYLSIINDYCLGGARAILSYEQLIKIKLVKPTENEIEKYVKISNKIEKSYNEYLTALNELSITI
ncbi:MAG: N-6 DNA methylase [Oscillospiraceae bacterium]|nr:N-6 DNA methylase [Oscillospiraceae bacterium]